MITVLYHKNLEALHQLEKLLLASDCATVIKCDVVLCYAVKEKSYSHCLTVLSHAASLANAFH